MNTFYERFVQMSHLTRIDLSQMLATTDIMWPMNENNILFQNVNPLESTFLKQADVPKWNSECIFTIHLFKYVHDYKKQW